jgi:hypothetical protein
MFTDVNAYGMNDLSIFVHTCERVFPCVIRIGFCA